MKVGVSLFAQNYVDWDRFEAEEAGADRKPQLVPDAQIYREQFHLGKLTEPLGFDSLWTVEHVVVPDSYESEYPYDPSGKMQGASSPMPDPLIWLSYVAHATSTIKLGTGILIVPQRNPAVLAKELATLDVLSNGRMLLGVGAGWLEEEFDALGVPFERRGERLDGPVGSATASSRPRATRWS